MSVNTYSDRKTIKIDRGRFSSLGTKAV